MATKSTTTPTFDAGDFQNQISTLSAILQSLQGKDPNDGAQKKSFNDFLSWMESSANRDGSSVAGSYAARQQASGLDASAAGLVGAQARFPVFGKMAESRMKFEEQQANEEYQRNSMRNDIAKALAALRLDYAKTVNEFNFNTSRAASEDSRWQQSFDLDRPLKTGQKTLQDLQIEAAQLAKRQADRTEAASLTPSDQVTSGYIPNSGPITPSTGTGMSNSVIVGSKFSGTKKPYGTTLTYTNPLTGLPY